MEKRDAKGLTEKEFLAKYDSNKYPKPSLTADILIFREKAASSEPDILLIQRKGHPYIEHWALPGGFAESGERIEDTAARELEEETGITGVAMELVGIYSKPGRDPRGWTVSAAYMAVVSEDQVKPVAGDDAGKVCWAGVSADRGTVRISINDVCIDNELAFDHYEIISDAFARYMDKHMHQKGSN